MKKILTAVALLLSVGFTACQNGQKPAETSEADSVVVATAETSAVTPEKIMAEGATLVNQTVEVKGMITHVCKHGGKKCSIIGEDPNLFIQVMVGGEMEVFTQEQIGTNITVKGTVKERQITKEMIAQQEEALKAAAANAENKAAEEHCSQSMHNVNRMKQWMTDNSKDYYPVYYVEGNSCTFEK